jgi:hypothetical protein
MMNVPGPREMQLARERNDRLKAEFKSKRTNSVVLAAAFALGCGIASAYEQPMLAFNSIVISLIFVVRTIDTHGHLQEIGRRSTKTLFPRMTVLQPDAPARGTTDSGTQN